MNYHFSFRAFSDEDQHIETIYSSKLSYGTHTWLTFMAELLTNLPSYWTEFIESQPPCRSFKLTLSFRTPLPINFCLKAYPRMPFAVQILVQTTGSKKSSQFWSHELSIRVQKPRHISSLFCTGQSLAVTNFIGCGLYHEITGMLRMVMDFQRSGAILL